jgi:hypothetical protein
MVLFAKRKHSKVIALYIFKREHYKKQKNPQLHIVIEDLSNF